MQYAKAFNHQHFGLRRLDSQQPRYVHYCSVRDTLRSSVVFARPAIRNQTSWPKTAVNVLSYSGKASAELSS